MPAGFLRGRGENREPGVNPGRYRHCERGGRTHDESRSLGSFPEKAVCAPGMREPGDLLKAVMSGPSCMGRWPFWRRKPAAAIHVLWVCRGRFVFWRDVHVQENGSAVSRPAAGHAGAAAVGGGGSAAAGRGAGAAPGEKRLPAGAGPADQGRPGPLAQSPGGCRPQGGSRKDCEQKA